MSVAFLFFQNSVFGETGTPTASSQESNATASALAQTVECNGAYKHHVQGVCMDDKHIYWSFTTAIVKTDLEGSVLKEVPADNHQGDLCVHDGKLLVAVNLGPFNSPSGNADSWIYVYSTDDLELEAKHPASEVIYGAGGIKVVGDSIFVVGGLPDAFNENYIYEYDTSFKFVKKHTLASGHTHLGIQTVEFSQGKWWFGCYGSPSVLLVASQDFELEGRYEFDAALGIVAIDETRFYVAQGPRENGLHKAKLRIVIPSDTKGLVAPPSL